MPASVFSDEDDVLFDPDTLKVPENPRHRRTIDTIALGASLSLGDDVELFCDMNWYPTDGGNAIAPDVMVLPTGAMPAGRTHPPTNSYRQDRTGGPSALAAVEVPSETDSFTGMWAKLDRYRGLGTVVYVVMVDHDLSVRRYAPDSADPLLWTGEPLPELGDIRIDFVDGVARVTLPTGVSGTSAAGLAEAMRNLEASKAEAEIRRLKEQLRVAGLEPDR